MNNKGKYLDTYRNQIPNIKLSKVPINKKIIFTYECKF